MALGFSIEHARDGPEKGQLRIRGCLKLTEAAPLWKELRRLEADAAPGQRLDFDMSGVERLDGGAMALLAFLRAHLQRRGVTSEFVGARERVQRVIHLYGGCCIMLDHESKSIIARGDPRLLRDTSEDPRVHAFFNRTPEAVRS